MSKIITSLFIGIMILLMALPVAAQGDETCTELIESALTSTAERCTTFANDFVCVGFETVEATPIEDAEVTLSNHGDLATLEDIASLTLSPLDVGTGTWGIAVIHSEEYNVALFGGVTYDVENGTLAPSGESECEAVFAGIVVSAQAETTLTLNGTDITFAGTIIIMPQPAGELIITAYVDDALVETDEGEVELEEGTSTEIILDEDGLPSEAPTDPTEADTTPYDDFAGVVATSVGPVDIPYPEASGATPLNGTWELVRASIYLYTVCLGSFGGQESVDQAPSTPIFVELDFSGGVNIPIFVEQQSGNSLPEHVIYDEPSPGVYHATDNSTSPPIEFTLYLVSETEIVTSTVYYIDEPGDSKCGVISFNYWEYRGE